MQNRRKKLVGVVVLLLAAVTLLTLPMLAVGRVTTTNASIPAGDLGNDIPLYDPTPSLCLTEGVEPTHYYDALGKESSRSHGPAADGPDAEVVYGVLLKRLCGNISVGGDPDLFRVIDGFVSGTDPNLPLTYEGWESGVTSLVNNMSQPRLVQETSPPGTRSTYMERDETGEIKIRTIEVEPRTSWFLVVTIAGKTVKLRTECGFQVEALTDEFPETLP